MSEPSSSEPASRGRGTVWWLFAGVLALGATGVLVITDDARLLRLGLVAALWSALIGGFAVARLRHRQTRDDDRAAELKRIYALELEREVAARREFELEAENDARRRVAEHNDNELEALRGELRVLRENLEHLVSGDVLFERVALQAESTRMRSLAENGQAYQGNRIIQSQDAAGRQLRAGNPRPPRAQVIQPDEFPPPPSQQPATPDANVASSMANARRDAPSEQWPSQPQQSYATPQEAASWDQRHEGDLGVVPPEGNAETSGSWTSPVHPGAHTAGKSVTELLATYGTNGESAPRRRRKG